MSERFEVLDRASTPLGIISLWRRREPTLGTDVYEVKLGDEYLMSSLFTEAEVELSRLGLAQLDANDLDVLVGGLGLGYTARAVLDDPRTRSLTVVEAVNEVISWHERELLPDTIGLAANPACHLVHGDFFALASNGEGFGSDTPKRYHAILLDIDHTPRHTLHPSHAAFYTPDGMRWITHALAQGGVFALWSDDPPDSDFLAILRQIFASAEAHIVKFANPLTGDQSSNTVYVATKDQTDG